jgi:hypothetical protein
MKDLIRGIDVLDAGKKPGRKLARNVLRDLQMTVLRTPESSVKHVAKSN